MEELVRGVVLRRAGEAIERVRTEHVTMHLIASWDGTEVIRQEIPGGRRFGYRPDEGWNALECMYILRGQAVWDNGKRRILLNPGDSITGTPVKEPCILEAVSDLVALYICSQPVFHLVSDELANFRDLAVTVEEKDGYTRDHCQRIQQLSAKVGRQLNLPPARMDYLLVGSFLHDLGKVGIPDSILKKPGKLTDEEYAIMKRHTVIGKEMLANTSAAPAGVILEQHHERLDGSGYPYGLAGDQITLEAQIVAVVDSYDAMTSDRVYRAALPLEEAIAEIQRGVGRLYRPDVVEAFMASLER